MTKKSMINSLFAKYKFPMCHIILGHTGIGVTFRSTMFNSLYLFTYNSYGEFQKARLIMQTVRTQNNGNRFIEQEWTIGVCTTVQIGERGAFTDVQIGERGKQRVKS